jgi:hypothetical protein
LLGGLLCRDEIEGEGRLEELWAMVERLEQEWHVQLPPGYNPK